MPEAVFSISAEINPVVNERELERQAQQLAGKLNNILGKQVNKIDIAPVSGNFRPFEQEIVRSHNALQRFTEQLGSDLPKKLRDVQRFGKGAFLKFADAVNVTRRDIVGFGGSILDTIRNTNKFEEALDGIKATGSTLADLPQNFEILASQIRSGTSALDQAALGGDRLAQIFQPIQRQGEAARTEFVDINAALDELNRTITRFAVASGAIKGVVSEFSLVGKEARALQQPFFRVQSLLNATGQESSVFAQRLHVLFEEAGQDPEALTAALIEARQAAQKTAGPLGLLGRALGTVTKEERAAAKAIRLELNASLIETGNADKVVGFQKIVTNIALARQRITDFVRGLDAVRTGLARILPGESPIGKLVDSAADGVTFFKVLRAEGVPALQAIRQASIEAFTQFKDVSGISFAVQRVKSELTGLGLFIGQTNIGQKINQSLGQLGNFLSTNLIDPLKAAGPQIKEAFAPIGTSIVEGLKAGIQAGKNVLLPAFNIIKDSVVNGLKKVLGIHSPAEVTKPHGKAIIEGIAEGMKGALNILLAPARAVKSILDTAFKPLASVGKVVGTAFAGLSAVALTTGVQFNTLQQVISGTLPVLLGSAQASETLLKQINELNDSSPFARSAFLELTRVLAGFGVEAERIAPLIDAIQQAVAATGGGEQDLLELGQAFARLKSQGRLSLDIIQSFSSRGIDVISLLGQEFNKTNGQIRDMISGGLIPANKAIDALTKGLKSKFDGATEAVSKNLPGALDRIRAKLRDAGAELTRAFVNPTGGGALVDFLNNLATTLSHITKNFLPLLRPALEAVGKAMVSVTDKIKKFTTSLGTAQVDKLVSSLSGLAPVLAAAAALLPGLLSGLPVIGGLLAGISGPEVAIVAALSTIKPVRDAFIDLAAAMVPIVKDLLPKISTFFQKASTALGPFIASLVAAIGPVFKAASDTIGELFVQLGPIVEALGRFFDAISPVVEIIKNAAIGYFQAWQSAIATAGPIIVDLIDILTEFANKLKPTLQGVAEFSKNFVHSADEVAAVGQRLVKPIEDFGNALVDIATSDFAQSVFGAISTAAQFLTDRVKDLAGALSVFVKTASFGRIHLDFDFSMDDFNAQTNAINADLKKTLEAAHKTADGIRDAFSAASKASENANKAVDDNTDTLKQALSTGDQLVNGVFEAAKASKAATAAVADARLKAAESTKELNALEAERSKALRDTITPLNELAVAERNLTRLRNDLRDGDREEIRIQEELNNLRGQQTADDRAELDRSIERAKIALNSARRAEIDLINESNRAENTSLNIAGLSLEQIKGRLKTVRATLSAQKQAKSVKSEQEKADERTTARLDVVDAEKNLADVTKARQQFEVDTSTKIRDNEERLLELRADKADKLLDEQEQLNHIADLRAGETSQQKLIIEFDGKIAAAKLASQKAQEAVTAAVTASALATLDMKNKQALLNGDLKTAADTQLQIWNLKKTGLGFDQATETSLTNQANIIHTAVADLEKSVIAANNLKEPLRQAALAALLATGEEASTLINRIKGGPHGEGAISDPAVLKGLDKLPDNIKDAVTAAFSSGLVLNADKSVATASAALIADIIQGVSEEQAVVQGRGELVNFRDILRKVLAALHMSIPGFAGGYAPGDLINSGMHNGVGLARMFEFGKEAVLPLTRQFDLARVVNNPAVLPKILNALPRWSMPSKNEEPILSSLKMPTRSVPAIVGSGSVHVDRRREQSELADYIGVAIKTAMVEALSETGGVGADVDIHVASPTNNEILIAREVARQLKKVLGNP